VRLFPRRQHLLRRDARSDLRSFCVAARHLRGLSRHAGKLEHVTLDQAYGPF
jgi:hypothetical protein